MAKDESKPSMDEAKCCGVVEEATARSRERRDKRRRKPMPWIVLKMTIAVTLGIIAYACYVYIGRFCVPMIKHNTGALGGRHLGIGFLVVFCVLALLMIWAYVRVCITSPGLAKNHVQKESQPMVDEALPVWWDSSRDIPGGAFNYTPAQQDSIAQPLRNMNSQQSMADDTDQDGEQYLKWAIFVLQLVLIVAEDNAAVTDAFPPIAEAHAARSTNVNVSAHNGSATRPSRMYTREPSQYPVLVPQYRYCHKEGFVKPPRAHHCRACGTCVLRYDHHCPWIGQCVGARNHKAGLSA
ncbi:uncharacterized protein FIBRA_02739 [Fibroporia radiculosa]|uniref:Palmitoyltransferase n=1 Tax=Fibroporia radiculosa TaxID=599839 RepID=J4H208_9APHY|nr:uncharacterized protein FIBRA_02739 [Fibroporia radiculosa]CCM00699.1 predicted protein [Fibroporia radiculosa]